MNAARRQGKTPHRQVRVDDEPWDAFGEAATAIGSDRSALLREFIAWFIREPTAKMPRRPPSPGVVEPSD